MLTLLADLTMSPGGVISWIMIGLVAGWLASMTMSGGGYGIVRDIVLGLVGADRWFYRGVLSRRPGGLLGKHRGVVSGCVRADCNRKSPHAWPRGTMTASPRSQEALSKR